MANDLGRLKSKVDKLDVDKLARIPIDLIKLCHVVKNNFVKRNDYNELSKKVNSIKATDTSALVKKAGYNTRFGDIEKKIIDHDYYSRTE